MQWIFAFLVTMLSALPMPLSARAEPVLRVTSESGEYCEALAHRLAAAPHGETGLPRSLGEEGRRLCASGHVRTGVAKLRRAIRAAQQAEARGQ